MDRALANRLLVAGLIVAVSAVATGCATGFERRFGEAEQLRQQAAEQGYEWLDTGRLLEQARTEAESGDSGTAMALVEKARFQAEAALEQAEHEAQAWKGRVVR